MLRGPLKQVVDELEQAGIGEVEVVEHERHGRLVAKALEEEAPAREEIRTFPTATPLEPEEGGESWSDDSSFLGIRNVTLERRGELRPSARRIILYGDTATRPHHLSQRP